MLGAYGNFVNRTLAFINKYVDSVIPEGTLDQQVLENINKTYKNVGEQIEKGTLEKLIHGISRV